MTIAGRLTEAEEARICALAERGLKAGQIALVEDPKEGRRRRAKIRKAVFRTWGRYYANYTMTLLRAIWEWGARGSRSGGMRRERFLARLR